MEFQGKDSLGFSEKITWLDVNGGYKSWLFIKEKERN